VAENVWPSLQLSGTTTIADTSAMRTLNHFRVNATRVTRIVHTTFVVIWFAVIVALFLSVDTLCTEAQDRAMPRTALVADTGAGFAFGDFDGDMRPDVPTVHTGLSDAASSRYDIRLQLSSGEPQQANFLSAPAGGLRLQLDDVNGDLAPDLVITTPWR